MPKRHLSLVQMYQIQAHLTTRLTRHQIAELVGCSAATVSRIARLCPPGAFLADVAAAARKRPAMRGPYKLKGELKTIVTRELKARRTPEEIAGRLKSEGKHFISAEAIYLMIYADKKQGGNLCTYLVRKRKERVPRSLVKMPRGRLAPGLSIEDRPEIVATNEEYGHFEADTIVLQNHKGCILTLVERKTKYVYTAFLKDRTSTRVLEQLVRMFRNCKIPVKSLTVDNGKEFAKHASITRRINIPVYFCHPYSSWERGLNEQTNGLIRRLIPKKTAYADITADYVKWVTQKVNGKYKKCHGFKSSLEVMAEVIKSHGVASQT